MILYLDANSIIYVIEGAASVRNTVVTQISEVENATGARIVTSRLSWLECRVKPLRDGNAELLRLYDGFFARGSLAVVEIGQQVIELATEIRARHRYKVPDAIHLATAVEQRADLFLTGDVGLAKFPELKIEIIR